MNSPEGEWRNWIRLEAWLGTLRHALRSLRRAPAFSFAVIGSLALGLGPNAATLSALQALVLRTLPFPEAERLVTVANVAEANGGQRLPSSTPQYRDFKASADLFDGFAAMRRETVTLDGDEAPVRVAKEIVTADFFTVLGVRPLVGNFFTSAEEVAGRDRVLVLSQAHWESRHLADPGVVGRTVSLDGQTFTIVGVAPRSLDVLGKGAAFYQPYAPAASKLDPQARYRGDLTLLARLKPGVGRASAHAQLVALETRFRDEVATPAMQSFVAGSGFRLVVEPLRPGGAAGDREGLWLLQGGALLVLLIGGVNVASLFLARGNARRAEFAIRVALGAGRGALGRQLLTESLVLAGGATLVGGALALLGLRGFNHYLPLLVPGAAPVELDVGLAGAAVAVSLGVAVLAGLLPLRTLGRRTAHAGETRTTSSRGSRRIGGLLVSFQVTVAVVLLVGASLLLRSFSNVMTVDPGFDAARVVQARISLPGRYSEATANVATRRRVVEAFRAIPGVEQVATALDPMLMPGARPVPFGLRGDASGTTGGRPPIHIVTVSPEYFATLGLRVLSGRGFDEADAFSKAPVAIVDETFAARCFPGEAVEGREIYLHRGLPLAVDGWPRIVGQVSRAKLTGLDRREQLPVVFVPMVGFAARNFTVLVRSPRRAPELLREMQAKLQAIDPALPLYGAGSVAEGYDNLLLARRGVTLLVGVFSGLALLLAGVGLYGVLTHDVSQRTRELGIRGAIGATRAQLVGLILRQGLGQVALGALAGLGGASLLTRHVESLLFGVTATDPVSYLAVSALLAGVAVLACWLPARRAATVDPLVALRAE